MGKTFLCAVMGMIVMASCSSDEILLLAIGVSSIEVTSGTDQKTLPGGTIAAPLTATVRDSRGTAVAADVAVTWTISAEGVVFADGTATATSKTNSKGVATSPLLKMGTMSELATVSAAVSGVTTVAAFTTKSTYCIGDNITRAPFATATGDGGASTPYVICTATQWNLIGSDATLVTKTFLLNADLDFATTALTPIGTRTVPFSGSFDGRGYTVSNLSLTASDYPVGLFPRLYLGATISNLKLTVKEIAAGSYYGVSPLVGQISRTSGSGAVTLSSITVTDTGASPTIAADNSVGGLIGDIEAGPSGTVVISNCAVSGVTMTAVSSWLGGLVGSAAGAGVSISDSQSTASTLTATGNVGGLVGTSNGISIVRSSSSNTVFAALSGGGLLGSGTTGDGASSITDSYATGAVSYTAARAGFGNFGGIAGNLTGTHTISRVYASGLVVGSGAGSTYAGGLVGQFSASNTISDSYFDSETTGQSQASGLNGTGGTAKTTAQMKTASTFDWATTSPGVWTLSDGAYPVLVA